MNDYSYRRRKLLIERMQHLESKKIHCFDCKEANCCTFELNSMQITPLECVEILASLQGSIDLNTLKDLMETNIRANGLDRPVPGNGKRALLRRYYTCPFFKGHEKGCGLSRSVKPLGCLGFNPTETGATGPEHCRSDQELLILQDQGNGSGDELTNAKMAVKLSLDWAKLPISLALADVLAKHPKTDWMYFLHTVVEEK